MDPPARRVGWLAAAFAVCSRVVRGARRAGPPVRVLQSHLVVELRIGTVHLVFGRAAPSRFWTLLRQLVTATCLGSP
jgi:hypothetical protein